MTMVKNINNVMELNNEDALKYTLLYIQLAPLQNNILHVLQKTMERYPEKLQIVWDRSDRPYSIQIRPNEANAQEWIKGIGPSQAHLQVGHLKERAEKIGLSLHLKTIEQTRNNPSLSNKTENDLKNNWKELYVEYLPEIKKYLENRYLDLCFSKILGRSKPKQTEAIKKIIKMINTPL